jgi:hypothetical protein
MLLLGRHGPTGQDEAGDGSSRVWPCSRLDPRAVDRDSAMCGAHELLNTIACSSSSDNQIRQHRVMAGSRLAVQEG